MKFKTLLIAVLACVGLMTTQEVKAQSTVRWTGNDYQELLNAEETELFLYNVGTGRFLIHGGDWGIQARLFYEDTGKILTLKRGSNNNIIFVTGQSTGVAQVLGCNVPQVTSAGNWANGDPGNEGNTFTVLMDGNERYANADWKTVAQWQSASIHGYRNWHFVRTSDTDTYTYYMYETLGGTDYYMGAVYGTNKNGNDYDANGALVSLSSSWDKVTWTTYNPTGSDVCTWTPTKDDELNGWTTTSSVQTSMQTHVKIFNADTDVKIEDLYKWRLVTKADLLNSITETDINDGLSTNLSYLINDRGFERNDWAFFGTATQPINTADAWNVGRLTDVTYTSSGAQANGYRYEYTWGYSSATYNGSSWSKTQHNAGTNTTDQPWNAPVRLKAQWDNRPDAKYGFLEFEGAGTVSTRIPVTKTGYYKVSCYGFYQGSRSHPGCLFATTTNPQGETGVAFSTLTTNALEQVSESPFLNSNKGEEAQVKEAGKIFINNNEDKQKYYREITIHANAGDYIYLGVAKDGATKSSNSDYRNGSTYYYHDTEWVGADQFDISYLGEAQPVVFDEDKEDLTYLGDASTQYTNQAIRLKRTFVKGAWNSFVFPLNMTAVQVRTAFGPGVRVAELSGLGRKENGTVTQSGYYIDFNTVSLPAEGNAITAGKLYLVMPEYEPTDAPATTAYPEGYKYYPLGNGTFSPSQFVSTAVQDVPDVTGTHENVAKSKATYVATTGYTNYTNGTITDAQLSSITNGVYVPKSYESGGITYGSYVLGTAAADATTTNMYRLKDNMRIKGFRGWIEDVPNATQSTAKVAINGIFDMDEPTFIEGLESSTSTRNDGRIYNINGQMVGQGEKLSTLPKGLYIVNGKKYVVK